MKPTSKTATLKAKQPPMYATVCDSRKPKTKYHQRREAKAALRNHLDYKFGRGLPPNFNFELYKFIDGEYELIFDIRSELGLSFFDGGTTDDELIDMIDW